MSLTPITIPHILQCIASSLACAELSRCSRVDKAWNEAFTPFLYRRIEVTAPGLSSLLPIKDDISLRFSLVSSLERHGHHVRSLSIRALNLNTAVFLAKHCQNLTKITTDLTHTETSFSNLHIITAANANIAHLTLDVCEVLQKNLVDLLKLLPKLKTAVLRFSTHWTANLIPDILNVCSLLEELVIKASKLRWQRGPSLCPSDTKVLPKYENLKRLSVHALFEPGDPFPFFVDLLRVCPSVSSLDLPFIANSGGISALCTVLQNMNPGCQELRLFSTHGTYEYDYSRDSDYGQIVKAIPLERLQHLSMEASAIGPRILDSLAIYHSHSLQTLSLSHARWSLPVEEGSAKIQCLLTTCPNLKHLDISSAIRATRHAVALLGEDAIRTPWVCLGIETLKLTIVRICRPTALRCRLAPDAATAPPSSVLSDKESKMIDDSEENERQHWCQSMQEELFVQLGRLHYLKELRIAPCTTDPSGGLGDNIDCLQWSLKHGLRHMGQCRQLESFVISRIYHGITVPDLQWMCEHWPKLNKASLRSFPQLALQNWIKTNWPR